MRSSLHDALRRVSAIVRRDLRITSAVAFALLGLLTVIDKYFDGPVCNSHAFQLTLDLLRWVASLGGLLGS